MTVCRHRRRSERFRRAPCDHYMYSWCFRRWKSFARRILCPIAHGGLALRMMTLLSTLRRYHVSWRSCSRVCATGAFRARSSHTIFFVTGSIDAPNDCQTTDVVAFPYRSGVTSAWRSMTVGTRYYVHAQIVWIVF